MNQITIKLMASLLAISLIFGVSACKKSDDDSDPESEKISLMVNGTPYNANLVQDANVGFGLVIAGTFPDGQHALGLYFDQDITEGSYDLSDPESYYRISWDIHHSLTNIERFWSESGELTIEEYNEEAGLIKGSFNGTCTSDNNNTVTITSGVFIAHI